MVYYGQPSRGCQNCKGRRIKCDEIRPACTQCRRSGRTCPGYLAESELLFRNETAVVKRRAHKLYSLLPAKSNPKTRNTQASSASSSPDQPSPVSLTRITKACNRTSPTVDSARRKKRSHANSSTQDVREIAPRSYTMPHSSIPPSFDSPDSRTACAMSFFFNSIVAIPRSMDSLRGYIEILGPMYEKAEPNSLLCRATHALALASCSNNRKSMLLRLEARRIYGKALHDLSIAIQDPIAARSDETLLSILLFSLYEVITSSKHFRIMWTRHINGAVTLVKLRGEEQLQRPQSLHLFRAVRAAMLKASVHQGCQIEEFPGPGGWKCDEKFEPNTANRLTLICLELPNIKYQAEHLLNGEKVSPSSGVDTIALVQAAKQIDRDLETWAVGVPEFWEPRVKMIYHDELEADETAEFWPGPIYNYRDISIANVWNEYRVSRIFCQAVILGCIATLPSDPRAEEIERLCTQAVHTTQQMVNDCCSTLPFLLGLSLETQKTQKGEQEAQREDEAAARLTGAHYASWPLSIMRKVPTIPEKQKKWLSYRLEQLSLKFELNEV